MEEADEHNPRALEVEYRWPRIPSRRCDEGEGFGSEIPRRVDPWSYLDGVFALWLQRSQWTEAALPHTESRILVNLTRVSPVLPPKGMGRIIHALASDFQPREVAVDARFGPGDRSGSQRSEGPSFRRV